MMASLRGVFQKKQYFLGIFPKMGGGGHLEGLSLPFTTHPIKLKVDNLTNTSGRPELRCFNAPKCLGTHWVL